MKKRIWMYLVATLIVAPAVVEAGDEYTCESYVSTYGDVPLWHMNVVVPTLSTVERDMMWERLDSAADIDIISARTRVIDFCSKEENAHKNIAKLYFNAISYGYVGLCCC